MPPKQQAAITVDAMIYLASPYSHPDSAVRQRRFEAACRAAAVLIQQGHVVVSPIAHSHAIAQYGSLPTDWHFWAEADRQLLAACDEVWVLQLDGWVHSHGVNAEIALARKLGKRVRFIPSSEDGGDTDGNGKSDEDSFGGDGPVAFDIWATPGDD